MTQMRRHSLRSFGICYSEGANTEPNDVLKTKTALAQTGHYKVPSHGIVPFPDRQMIDGLKSFQRENGLTVDGVMRPKGPTETKIKEKISEQEKKDRAAIEQQRAYTSPIIPTDLSMPSLPIQPQPIPTPMPPQPIRPPLIPTPLPPNLGPAPIQPPINPMPGRPIIGQPVVGQPNIENRTVRLMRDKTKGAIPRKRTNTHGANDGTQLAFAPVLAFGPWLAHFLGVATVAIAMQIYNQATLSEQQEYDTAYDDYLGLDDVDTGDDSDKNHSECRERWMWEHEDYCDHIGEEYGVDEKWSCQERANDRLTSCEKMGYPEPIDLQEWYPPRDNPQY